MKEQIKRHLELEKMMAGDEIMLDMPEKVCNDSIDSNNGNETLETLAPVVASCTKCGLSETRTNTVFGEGDINADLMFIGEAPGADEDKTGRPFVGRAGKLLTKMIEAMGIKREDVFIANILKCRPPSNRNPEKIEMEQCTPYLDKQIEMIQPKVICTLGSFATRYILNTEERISLLRGKISSYKDVPVIPTFHPSYLLRNQSAKKEAWEDLKLAMKLLEK